MIKFKLPKLNFKKNKSTLTPEKRKRRKRILIIKLFVLLFVVFAFLYATGVDAQAPAILNSIVRTINPPKPIVKSDKTLPADIQTAIERLSAENIKNNQAEENLAMTLDSQMPSDTSLLSDINDTLQLVTGSPSDKAKLRLRRIDRKIQKLVEILEKDKSDKGVDKAVELIKQIGQETGVVVSDKNVQNDREILTLLIQQYNRSLLIIQKVEDTLPLRSVLKLEDARETYLEKPAQDSLNASGNLQVIHNIGTQEVEKQVGGDYVELKAIELVTDLKGGLNQQTIEKLEILEQEMAAVFEKRMLRLPRDVRERKLQSYVKYSHGNAFRQIQGFDHLQEHLTDRELILAVERAKETAVEKLADKVFENYTKEDNDKFLDKYLKEPEDIRVLALLQFYIISGDNEDYKKILMEQTSDNQKRVVSIFGSDLNAIDNLNGDDVLSLSIITQIEQYLINSPEVSVEVKAHVKKVKEDTLKAFLANISKKDFVSQTKSAYNPVSKTADVRLLLLNLQTILLLRSIQDDVNATDRQKLNTALSAYSSILNEYLLLQVNDPQDFARYKKFIDSNQDVKQQLQRNLGTRFFASLDKKSQVMEGLAQRQNQKLYEEVQRLNQKIFLTDGKTDTEKRLPLSVQEEIRKLKRELASRNIPQLTLPSGVVLPETAKLSDEAEAAIVQAARDKIKKAKQSEEVLLDLTLQAKDLGVSKQSILPGNIFYPLKQLYKKIALLVTPDPLARANLLIHFSNEKTVEAATLLEKSQSRENIGRVLGILDEVKSDFDLLKKNSESINILKSKNPKGVDELISKIIDNGLARQTLFAAVQNKVHGEDFVKVEKTRQQVLSDGISTLLTLTDNDAQKLVTKLESSLDKQSGSYFKNLKAIELLTEIKRAQPKEVKEILQLSEVKIAKRLEEKLLALPKEERNQRLVAYADTFPGNPVRQFEAYEKLKDNFTNTETLILVEALKDKAIHNLKILISEIHDDSVLQEFTNSVIGNQPEDLRIILEIELRTSTSFSNEDVQMSPFVQKIEDIQAKVEDNIIETFKNNPDGLAHSGFFTDLGTGHTSVVDVRVAQELEEAFERTPEVSPMVIETIQELENDIINDFIEEASNLDLSNNGDSDAIHILEPIPQIIETLVDLQNEVTGEQANAIGNAIEHQVEIIEEYIGTINDQEVLDTYLEQIEQNPVVSNVIESVDGNHFHEIVEQVSQELNQTETQEQAQLEETIGQIEEEILTNNNSPILETLPEVVQEEIIETSNQVPVDQVPDATVVETVVETTTNTVETVSTPSPSVVSEPPVAPTAPTTETIAPPPVVPGL